MNARFNKPVALSVRDPVSMLDVTRTAASCRLYFVVTVMGVNGALFSVRSRELICSAGA
jgi:hypothetical protein